jgi:hypothetical protein
MRDGGGAPFGMALTIGEGMRVSTVDETMPAITAFDVD